MGPISIRGATLVAEINATRKKLPPIWKANSGRTSHSAPVPNAQKKNTEKTGIVFRLRTSLSADFLESKFVSLLKENRGDAITGKEHGRTSLRDFFVRS